MTKDPAVSVSVHGVRELALGSYVLAARIESKAGKEFGQVADQTADVVRARVPRVSGRLAASVNAEQRGSAALVEIGGPGVPYAGWIEFGGTRGRTYYPRGRYLFPTALAAEPALVTAGEKAAKDEIRGFPWPRPL